MLNVHTTLHLHKERPLTTEHMIFFTGHYGACNEQLMRLVLVYGGPISVSFEVYPDFRQYKSGIYHHTGLGDFRPFEVSNCALSLPMPYVSVPGSTPRAEAVYPKMINCHFNLELTQNLSMVKIWYSSILT